MSHTAHAPGRRARRRVRGCIDKISAGLSPDDLKKHPCELVGGPFNSWIDVSGPSIFSHSHVWHHACSTLPEGFLESSYWKIKICTPSVHMGWSDAGSVPMRLGANVTDDYSPELSGHPRLSDMFNLQGDDMQAPALGITTHYSLLLFPEERPQCSTDGTSDNKQSATRLTGAEGLPRLKGTEPMLAILPWRPDATASGLSRAGAFPNQTLGSAHRQSSRPSVTGSSTAPRAVETPGIHFGIREARSFDQNLSRTPRASTK